MTSNLRTLAVVVGMLLGLVLVVTTGLAVLAGLLSNPTPWNFPGDPPLFEVLIRVSAVSAVGSVAGWLLVNRLAPPERRQLLSSMPRWCAIVSLAILIAAGFGILERHGPRWAAVRQGIRHHADRVAGAVGGKDTVLSKEEFARVKGELMPNPMALHLPGHGTVVLEMISRAYPYVGTRFGGGSNTVLDPRTMFCMYSD